MQLDEWEANGRTKYVLRYWCKAGLRAVDVYQRKRVEGMREDTIKMSLGRYVIYSIKQLCSFSGGISRRASSRNPKNFQRTLALQKRANERFYEENTNIQNIRLTLLDESALCTFPHHLIYLPVLIMLPSEVALDMKPSFPRRPEPARGLTNSLLGRIRARKDASDSGSHTDSGSEMSAPGDARNPSLPHQSEETSENDSDEEKHEEEEVSDTLSRTRSRRKS